MKNTDFSPINFFVSLLYQISMEFIENVHNKFLIHAEHHNYNFYIL